MKALHNEVNELHGERKVGKERNIYISISKSIHTISRNPLQLLPFFTLYVLLLVWLVGRGVYVIGCSKSMKRNRCAIKFLRISLICNGNLIKIL